jgi:hypothetical protein
VQRQQGQQLGTDSENGLSQPNSQALICKFLHMEDVYDQHYFFIGTADL